MDVVEDEKFGVDAGDKAGRLSFFSSVFFFSVKLEVMTRSIMRETEVTRDRS